MSSKDYFRPRGDITTVLDLTDRDSQDNTYFPIDAEQSWFHRTSNQTVYPTAMSIQEFTQRGPSDWGQTLSPMNPSGTPKFRRWAVASSL